ncbi:MAG TPA: IS110 family transposase [Solirubrobacteraceae bacterium]
MGRRKPPEPEPDPASLHVVHPHAAAVDVHSDNHVACVGPDRVRTFAAYSADLHALADWFTENGVTSVVLESTGVYWIPLFELLEARGFEVFLIEPSQASHCGARPKTDRLDCQWLQRLHTFGLLRPSFRPPDAVLALRGYWRQRQMLVRYASHHVQHMQKALEQMNLKLTEVVSSITGVTGTAIVAAILQGERDPAKLAALRHERCARSEAEIARALEGTWRPEHLFALEQAFALYQYLHRQIDDCDRRIEAELDRLPDRRDAEAATTPRPRRRGRKPNDPRFDAAAKLARALGVDVTAIEGIDAATATVILAETGGDVSRFPSEKHFASWLGLCPRTDRSNRTERRRTPRKGKNRVAQALRMAAQAVGRTPTALGAFYRRIKSRIGGRGAITATAHKLSRLVYRMLRYGSDYVSQSLAEYESKLREKRERALRRKAHALGYELVAKGPQVPGVT